MTDFCPKIKRRKSLKREDWIKMVDKERIALMTKLAVYDKSEGKKDRQKLQYFRHDYIYRQNMWTRFFVFIGCLILFFFYVLHKLAFESIDLYNYDYKGEGLKLLIFYLAVAGVYTIIGTIKATTEYERAKSRLKLYTSLLNKLDGVPDDISPEALDHQKAKKEKNSDGSVTRNS